MSVVPGWMREYFDGTRELKMEAANVVAEKEYREETREAREGLFSFANSGEYVRLRDELDLIAKSVLPSEEAGLDAAGAFWYRRGLEQAIHTLDQFMAVANEDTEDGRRDHS